jgi:cell division septum initiation protein DivIVA
MEQAKETVGKATEQLADKAQELGGQAQQRLREQIDGRSTDIGDGVAATAAAVRTASQQLREQGQDLSAQIIEQAAEKAQQLGDYLRGSSADRLLHDVEDLGRRQPWAVIAGGIAAGFLGARFLRASSVSRYEQRFPSTGAPTARGTSTSAGRDLRTGDRASGASEATLAGSATDTLRGTSARVGTTTGAGAG